MMLVVDPGEDGGAERVKVEELVRSSVEKDSSAGKELSEKTESLTLTLDLDL